MKRSGNRRNERGATAIAAHCYQSRSGEAVVMRVIWDGRADIAGAEVFNIASKSDRPAVPYSHVAALSGPQSLTARTIKALSSCM